MLHLKIVNDKRQCCDIKLSSIIFLIFLKDGVNLPSPRIPCVNGYGVMLSDCVSKNLLRWEVKGEKAIY